MSDAKIIGIVVGLCVLGFLVAVPIVANRGGPQQSKTKQPQPKPAPAAISAPAPIARIATSASPKPSRSWRKATVSGGVWVTRKNGSSEIMRGLQVTVIDKTVPAAVVAGEIQARLADSRDSLLRRKEAIARYMAQIKDGDSIDKVTAEAMYDATKPFVEEDIARHKRIEAMAAGPIGDTDTLAAYDMLRPASLLGVVYFDGVVRAIAVAGTRTGIDGRYEIPDVPHGDYYLHAKARSDLWTVEWLVPITVASGGVKVDLDNGNAVEVFNANR